RREYPQLVGASLLAINNSIRAAKSRAGSLLHPMLPNVRFVDLLLRALDCTGWAGNGRMRAMSEKTSKTDSPKVAQHDGGHEHTGTSAGDNAPKQSSNKQSAGIDPSKVIEIGGPRGPEPTRYGDWERKGQCIDF